MSEEVWVYWDVDGVFNAVSRGIRPSWGWECDGSKWAYSGFQILTSPDLVAEVNALTQKPHVRSFWLTTWEDDAPKELCPAVGLEGSQWPVLHRTTPLRGTAWWKLQAIQRHLPEGQKALWIDDDIQFDKGALNWLSENPNVTAMSPRSELGITKRLMDKIKEVAG